jgi:hypothetical protein
MDHLGRARVHAQAVVRLFLAGAALLLVGEPPVEEAELGVDAVAVAEHAACKRHTDVKVAVRVAEQRLEEQFGALVADQVADQVQVEALVAERVVALVAEQEGVAVPVVAKAVALAQEEQLAVEQAVVEPELVTAAVVVEPEEVVGVGLVVPVVAALGRLVAPTS